MTYSKECKYIRTRLLENNERAQLKNKLLLDVSFKGDALKIQPDMLDIPDFGGEKVDNRHLDLIKALEKHSLRKSPLRNFFPKARSWVGEDGRTFSRESRSVYSSYVEGRSEGHHITGMTESDIYKVEYEGLDQSKLHEEVKIENMRLWLHKIERKLKLARWKQYKKKVLTRYGIPLVHLPYEDDTGNKKILDTPLLKLAKIVNFESHSNENDPHVPIVKKNKDGSIDVQLVPLCKLGLLNTYQRSKRHVEKDKSQPFFTDTSMPQVMSATCPYNATVVYTDGSCRNNGQPDSKAGIGVFFGDKDSRNLSERLPGSVQTNQRAEAYVSIGTVDVNFL